MLGIIINIVFTILYLKGRIGKKLVAVLNIVFSFIAPGILIMFSNEFAEHKANQNSHKSK